MRKRTKKPLGSVSHHILLALAERDRHGYAIRKTAERTSGGAVRLGPGTLYAALRRLEDGGLIEESAWRPDPDLDDQRRRYYRLTAHGREQLAAEAERLRTFVQLADRLLGLSRRGTEA